MWSGSYNLILLINFVKYFVVMRQIYC